MNLSTITEIVKKYSPTLGAIVGTANPLAGLIFSAIANAVGANPTDVTDVAKKMTQDPELELKLQQIELEFAKIDSSNYIASLNDVASARDRDEKIIEDASKPNAPIIVSLIAFIPHMLTMLTGFGIVMLGVVRMYVHGANVNDTLITMIAAQLLAIYGQQCKFYYGASKTETKE